MDVEIVIVDIEACSYFFFVHVPLPLSFSEGGAMHKCFLFLSVPIIFFFLAACGGGGESGPPVSPSPDPREPTDPRSSPSNPAYHLGTARFTTHQPNVLEQIGAHHAYALGLTGRGIRIGIDDTIVDYTQRAEFGNRVKLNDEDGAKLYYDRPIADLPFLDVDDCRFDPGCTIWTGNSGGDSAVINGWVLRIVNQDGWPTQEDSVFVLDEYYSEFDALERLLRWKEVPTPYDMGNHGTIVASIAAGDNLGVAPQATIIPYANNFDPDDQDEDAFISSELRFLISQLSAADRIELDRILSQQQRDAYAKFDIINRSYGIGLYDQDEVSRILDAEIMWYRQNLPQTFVAQLQTDRSAAEKTIIVYAAGNDSEDWSSFQADLPYHMPDLRGHHLSVIATDPRTESITDFSNRCGPLPNDWNAARHGPHYCLAAPGIVRGLVPNPNNHGNGTVTDELPGTSFAAPVVSGALALLMEHFRGTRGNTAIVKRMLDTADRSGRYADLETYGAGHLDLEAALSPVGTLNAGQSAQPLSRTTLQVPAAFGFVARHVENVELASFDEQGFPFWVPVTTLVSTRSAGRSWIPRLEGHAAVGSMPTTDPFALGLHWMPDADDETLWLADGYGWISGFGPTSANIARLPHHGGWGYGMSVDGAGYLGSQTSGAFGSDPRSGMIWASRAFRHDLDDGWSLDITGTLGLGVPQYEDNAIFQASASVLSAMSMKVGTDNWGFTVEQPLRAESGTGTFRVENGRIENGRRLFDVHQVPLRPDAREIRTALHHEREALGGNIAVEVGHTINAGHLPGESETGIGMAYRMTW